MVEYTQVDVFALIHQDIWETPTVFVYDRDDGEYESIDRWEYIKMLLEIRKDIDSRLEEYLERYVKRFE